jgi:hypothetical protein
MLLNFLPTKLRECAASRMAQPEMQRPRTKHQGGDQPSTPSSLTSMPGVPKRHPYEPPAPNPNFEPGTASKTPHRKPQAAINYPQSNIDIPLIILNSVPE